jgi:hypothetical protein
MKQQRLERKYERSICFDEVSLNQVKEMAEEDGLCFSALIRTLVRRQFKQRKAEELG